MNMYKPRVCLVPEDAVRGCQIPVYDPPHCFSVNIHRFKTRLLSWVAECLAGVNKALGSIPSPVGARGGEMVKLKHLFKEYGLWNYLNLEFKYQHCHT